jgi:FtsP/CotA-like multicopper oxidase with cupredoxin domain
MFNWRIKRLREAMLVLLMLTVLMTGTSFAAEFFLRAEAVSKTMPDGTVVAMWGYALDTTFGGGEGGAATVPGPPLVVPPGDTTITIHLDNNLTEPTSIVIPGQITTMVPTWTDNTTGARTSVTQRVRSFAHETAPGNGAQVDYTWTNVHPGTYLYHSGTHPQVQVQMGLYGAVKIDAAAGNVYNDASSAYTNEATLIYSEIDPVIANAVATGNYGPGMAVTSTIDYAPKYFLVNGEPFAPGASSMPAGNSGETLLIRFLNAGLMTHVPMLEGQYMTVIAEDGNLYPFSREQYSVLLPALKTMDAVLTPAAGGYIPVYDRAMHLTNAAASPGGMLTYLSVSAATQYLLTVTVPSGNGTVVTTSAPGGIDCGTDCTELYNAGTEVTLDAVPDAGFYFFDWSGDCTGTGDCSVTMNIASAVAATFVPSPPLGAGVFRKGTWFLDSNRSGTWDGIPTDIQYSFGLAADIPVSGDWNNDGNTEIGVFRDGTWVLDMDGNGILQAWADVTFVFGTAGDKPVTGDWNGDGITDVGVMRNRTWLLDSDGDQIYNPGTDTSFDFGLATDIPAPGDWNGDGTTDVGVFRDNGWWYLDSDGVQGWNGGTDTSLKFGKTTDIPVPGDWDGDGVTNVGVFRGNGWWYLDSDGVLGYNAGTDAVFKFGKNGDTPVSGHW